MGKKTPAGNWKRETNRERNKPEPMVLVGFGKYDLPFLMSLIGTDEEHMLTYEPFIKGWPPRYRRVSICSDEEIDTFKEFTTYITRAASQG